MKLPCPCCGRPNQLVVFAQRLDIDGRHIQIDICRNCLVLVNKTDLNNANIDVTAAEGHQAEGADLFYSDKLGESETDRLLSSGSDIVNFLVANILTPPPNGNFVDLGAGLGHIAAAAKEKFSSTWAIDFNTRLLHQMSENYPEHLRPHIGKSLDEVEGPISVVVAWHSLEHMTNPHMVGKAIFARMEPGGAFFIQVPAYRDPYIVRSHLTYFNEAAIRTYCTAAGFICENVWHDEELQFLTCLARKPLRR